jgi:putative endonuclease
MTGRRVSLGRRGEDLAADELTQRGYEIVDRNWYCQIGEVDIVTRRAEVWTFFEVRTRRGRAFGTPEESVTPRKMKRMTHVAQLYLSAHDVNVHEIDWRIGVVAVEMDEVGYLLRVDIYENLW